MDWALERHPQLDWGSKKKMYLTWIPSQAEDDFFVYICTIPNYLI
jgi:hypothetical protein